jgi:ribosomal protein S18 acetylase RimI-like enzyme
MPVLYRTASINDATELMRLNDAFNGYNTNTLEGIRQGFLRPDAETVFVAGSGGRLAGFLCGQLLKSVCYSAFYAEITELFVEEASRGQGIGKGLILFAEDYYRKSGIHDFQLFTSGKNTNAQAFYEHMGYRSQDDILYRKRDSREQGE